MGSERDKLNDPKSEGAPRRQYQKPTVRTLGTVRDLTLASSSVVGTDGLNPLLSTKSGG
jgi:hypothetical protein